MAAGEDNPVLVIERADDVAVFAQARLAQRRQHLLGVAVTHLQYRAQLFAEQGRRVVLADVVERDSETDPAGEGHFAEGNEQAAVGAVVIGEDKVLLIECLDGVEEFTQGIGIVKSAG